MKEYTYYFANGETKTIEVSDEMYKELTNLDKEEENRKRRERYHEVSLDELEENGNRLSKDSTEAMIDRIEEINLIKKIYGPLTETQQRRLEEFADGKTISEIAKDDNTHFTSVEKSIKTAIKKANKFVQKVES